MNDKSQSRVRIAVLGGGVAGLACAWELLRRGANVCVYEAERAGRGALWASGGMLAGGFECAEAKSGAVFVALAQRGMALWHGWSKELGPAAIGFRAAGVMVPASINSEKRHLEALRVCAASQGIKTVLSSDIPSDIKAGIGLCFPDDGELDNRLLGCRLADAVRSAGGRIREQTRVRGLSPAQNGVEVRTANEFDHFDQVVLATGHEIEGLVDIEPALQHIRPVKGQMLALAPGDVDLPFCLRAPDIYMSQKCDGRIVIGASSEIDRNDAAVDGMIINDLRARAERWVPSLKRQVELERWAGIRPSTSDGLPILGPGQFPGIHLALGLYRNGVLLAPAVAELVADSVMSGHEVPTKFRADRFHSR
jgi:glycine oxidase